MKNNRGVTLVEIIVVIAIMAILAGGIALSSGMIDNWQLNSGAKAFESIYAKARLQSMVKSNIRGMVIYGNDGIIKFGIASKEDMDNSEFKLISNEVSINSKISISITLQQADSHGVVALDPSAEPRIYSVSTIGGGKPINPTLTDGKLNLAAIKFNKGTGAELPIVYNNIADFPVGIPNGLVTRVTLELKGKKVSYKIEPVTGVFTKD